MKILMESTSKEAKSDFTSGTNPHQTINQQDWIREGSPPPFLDNTTEHGNKRNETAFTLEVTIKKETALEEKKDGIGDSLFSHIVVLMDLYVDSDCEGTSTIYGKLTLEDVLCIISRKRGNA